MMKYKSFYILIFYGVISSNYLISAESSKENGAGGRKSSSLVDPYFSLLCRYEGTQTKHAHLIALQKVWETTGDREKITRGLEGVGEKWSEPDGNLAQLIASLNEQMAVLQVQVKEETAKVERKRKEEEEKHRQRRMSEGDPFENARKRDNGRTHSVSFY